MRWARLARGGAEMLRDTDYADHFLYRTVRRRASWLVWFVSIGGAIALGGFLAELAHSYGLI